MTRPLTESLGYGSAVSAYSNYTTWSDPERINDGSVARQAGIGSTVLGAGVWTDSIAFDFGSPARIDSATHYASSSGAERWDHVEIDGTPVAGTWVLGPGDWEDVASAMTWTPDDGPSIGTVLTFVATQTHGGLQFFGLINVAEIAIAGELLPFPAVLADWGADGFGPAGSSDDLSADVASWRISRGASAEVTGGAQPGSATLVLNNPEDDRYNPLNASGPLYGALRDGVPVWIAANADGGLYGDDMRGLFGGRIKDITPIPQGGGTRALKVEITCEDALGWLGRTPVQIEAALDRSHGEVRAAVLAAAGESSAVLPSEIMRLPLSSWDGSALAALEALNGVTGTRHAIRPANDPADWYAYTARGRQWRLDGTVDASLDAGDDHVTGTDGWRLSADTVINQQKATVTPVSFTEGAVVVWEAPVLPFTVRSGTPWTTWVEFDDYVKDAAASFNRTGTAPTVTLEAFGATARLTITSAGTTVITALQIEGRLARRAPAVSVVVDDAASQAAPRGIRAGSDISGDLLGSESAARGIASHIVWRYGSPQFRPTLTVVNWLPEQFGIDLFDTVAVTIAQLGMAARLFEVVGVTHEATLAASADACLHVATFVLQECRVQADPGWFVLDASRLDSADVLAY